MRPPFSFYGEVHVEPQAIAQLAAHVTKKTSQVRKIVQIRVKSEKEKAISLEMDLELSVGEKSLLTVAQQVRERVASSVRYFTGLDVKTVNVQIAKVRLS